MQYLLQIFSSGTSEEWDRLSEDEQNAIMGEYFALSATPGVVGGAQLQSAETATTVRVEGGRTLTTDGPFPETKRGARRLLPDRGRRSRRRDRDRGPHSGRPARRRHRGPPAWSSVDRAGLSRALGPRPRALIGFLGDLDLAEEAAQEAFASRGRTLATRRRTPASPGGWLIASGATGRSTASGAIGCWPRRPGCSMYPSR